MVEKAKWNTREVTVYEGGPQELAADNVHLHTVINMDLQKSLKPQCRFAPETVNSERCLRQQMIELIFELNESSVKHCNLVKSLQSMEDDLSRSVSNFHNLLLNIGKLEKVNYKVLTPAERRAIFSATEAYRLSFLYHRAFENSKDRLCSMIFNMEKLKPDTLPTECNDSTDHSQSNSPVSKTLDDAVNSESPNVQVEGSILQESDIVDVCIGNEQNRDAGSTIADAPHSLLDSFITTECTQERLQPSTASPDIVDPSHMSPSCDGLQSDQNASDSPSISQGSELLSVGCNDLSQLLLIDADEIQSCSEDIVLPAEEPILAPEDSFTKTQEETIDDSNEDSSPDTAFASPSSRRQSVEESLENALGFGCARDMPFSKEFIDKAKGNHFLKKFVPVPPSKFSPDLRMKISPHNVSFRKNSESAVSRVNGYEKDFFLGKHCESTKIGNDHIIPSAMESVQGANRESEDNCPPVKLSLNLKLGKVNIVSSPSHRSAPATPIYTPEAVTLPVSPPIGLPITSVDKLVHSTDGNAETKAPSTNGVSINEEDDILIVYESKKTGQLLNGVPITVIETPEPLPKRMKISESCQDVNTVPRSQSTQSDNQRPGFIPPGNRNIFHVNAMEHNRNAILARGMTINQLPMTDFRSMLPMIYPYGFFNPNLTEWGPRRNQSLGPNNLVKGPAIPKNPFGRRC